MHDCVLYQVFYDPGSFTGFANQCILWSIESQTHLPKLQLHFDTGDVTEQEEEIVHVAAEHVSRLLARLVTQKVAMHKSQVSSTPGVLRILSGSKGWKGVDECIQRRLTVVVLMFLD